MRDGNLTPMDDWSPEWAQPVFEPEPEPVEEERVGSDVESTTTVSGTFAKTEDGTPAMLVSQVTSDRDTHSAANTLRRARRKLTDFVFWIIGILIVSGIVSWMANGGIRTIRSFFGL